MCVLYIEKDKITRAKQNNHFAVCVGPTLGSLDPDSRAQDVSTHARDVLSGQILRKLASAADASQTSFFNRISTPDPSWLARAHPGVPDGDSGTV